MKKLKMGVLGYGQRGEYLVNLIVKELNEFDIVAVSDYYEDRVKKAVDYLKSNGREVTGYTNSIDLMEKENLDCVLIATPWSSHIKLSIEAMKRNIPVALEVGGGYDIYELWKLVDTYEETKTPFMLMENCCYGRLEMMTMNMVEKGILGEIVHVSGGYLHDLRDEVSEGYYRKHYRLDNYRKRNAENYPTHEVGPLAKILGINRGNRFMTISSHASKSAGLCEYIKNNNTDKLADVRNLQFKQGDIITTTIQCSNGELVTLKLDTTLPRYYSRGFFVQGTKGLVNEDNRSVYLEDDVEKNAHFYWHKYFNNLDEYFEKYEHPVWENYIKEGVKEGHDGMDYLVFKAFGKALINGEPMPIDVYDTVTWMAITTLSEQSISLGGQVLPFPDFTRGEWIYDNKSLVKYD